MEIYIESVVVLATLIVAGLLVNRPSEPFPIVRFVNNLSLPWKSTDCPWYLQDWWRLYGLLPHCILLNI